MASSYQEFIALYKKLEVDRLIKLMEIESKKALTVSQGQDGHFTILKFTNGYKVTLGTPDLDTGQGRSQVRQLDSFDTLKAALVHCLAMAAIGKTGLELPDPEHPECDWCQLGMIRDRVSSTEVWHYDEDLPGQSFKCKYND